MFQKVEKIWKVSNPHLVQRNTYKYLGDDVILYVSDKPNKNIWYMIQMMIKWFILEI